MSLAKRIECDRCPSLDDPATDSPIKASVGSGGTNLVDDVKVIQQMLNGLTPLEGGPVEALVVDGIVGPKTTAAIVKYQTFAMKWADGRIEPGKRTIKTLVGYIVESPTVAFGRLGFARTPQAGSSATPIPLPAPTPPAEQALAIQVANISMRVMEPRIGALRWRLTRVGSAMEALMNKHFAFKKDKVNTNDIARLQKILSGIHFYLARFNAFGKLPVENVVVFDPVPTNSVIAWTVRGGDKMSRKQVQIYVDKGKVVKAPGQSIFITNLFESQPREQKHWTMLHEFCHFTGGRDGTVQRVDDQDKGYAFESKFRSLSKTERMHNAESLSLFFLECVFGTQTVVNLPRLVSYKADFDVFPKVRSDGTLLTS